MDIKEMLVNFTNKYEHQVQSSVPGLTFLQSRLPYERKQIVKDIVLKNDTSYLSTRNLLKMREQDCFDSAYNDKKPCRKFGQLSYIWKYALRYGRIDILERMFYYSGKEEAKETHIMGFFIIESRDAEIMYYFANRCNLRGEVTLNIIMTFLVASHKTTENKLERLNWLYRYVVFLLNEGTFFKNIYFEDALLHRSRDNISHYGTINTNDSLLKCLCRDPKLKKWLLDKIITPRYKEIIENYSPPANQS